jgi:hypothetical protein
MFGLPLGRWSAPRLGIAIVTYKRLNQLQQLVAAIREHTKTPHTLVIAEDGGQDGTVEWGRTEGIQVISGANRGVGWNKNRGLFSLAAKGCDSILLLEDDCHPVEAGWEQSWIEAIRTWHHVSFAHRVVMDDVIAGTGTALDPYVSIRSSGACMAVSAAAFRQVGYFDTRFKGYGIEHKEWTARLLRAGYGMRPVATAEKTINNGRLFITGGLIADALPSHKDKASVVRNREIAKQLKKEPLFRAPWHTMEEREQFLKEIHGAKVTTRIPTVHIYKMLRRSVTPPTPMQPIAGLGARMRTALARARALRSRYGGQLSHPIRAKLPDHKEIAKA